MRQLFLRPRSRYATWAACGAIAVAASVLAGAGPRSAAAQLTYNGTTFVHGFASSPKIWQDGYPDLGGMSTPGYLAQTVVLGTVGTPDLNAKLAFDPEVTNLANFAASSGNTSVLVGHSMGGLAARRFYLNYPGQRGSVAGIVAVTSPHQGAPLADSAARIQGFFLDVQRRVNGGIRATLQVAESGLVDLVGAVFAARGGGTAAGFFLELGTALSFTYVGPNVQVNVVNGFSGVLNAPALADLRPSSPVVQQLNANTADAALPRANVYGIIPFENAALRLGAASAPGNEDATFNSYVRTKNVALKAFHICRAVGYFTIVNWGNGRACGFGIRMLDRIDDHWARAVNGTATRLPFDGVVPNARSNYPGLTDVTRQFPVTGASHLNVYQRRFSLNRVSAAMLSVGMRQTSAPQWAQAAGYLTEVAVGADGTVWGVNSANQIFRWNGGGWDVIGGYLAQVAVGSAGQVWGVNSADQIFRWNGGGWSVIGGYLKQVAVAADGTVWGVNSADQIFRWNGGGWDVIAGSLKQVAVGSAGQVWGVDESDRIFHWNGSGWDQIAGYLEQVAVGADGTVWGVNSANQIFRWNGGGWDVMAGTLQEVSVGSAGQVWGVTTSDQILHTTGAR